MFLKRLETVGFKSFAERTTIEFVPGVTAVVGPNGSGKSNIIDAIRWVLGEQSAKSLRGQKMEDIIFQGSDTRNQLNFAEVSLILNNEDTVLPIDYQEVNVTRRVYRSGESEFYINKQACRLKDIVDLFMDTGLGRESFSIIGQGKIEEILSSKAEERRAIFEEAAGVLKYKQRKIKAEFKLQETANNLDRVEDIIHEINKQMAPLEAQAKTAKAYQQMQANLQDVEIALYVTEIKQLHERWQALLAEVEADKMQELQEQTAINEREAKLVKVRQELHQLEEETAHLQEVLINETEKAEQLDGQRNLWHERAKHIAENKTKLIKQHNIVTDRIKTSEVNQEEEQEKLTKAASALQTTTDHIAGLTAALSRGTDDIEAEIENLKADYIEKLNEQAVLRSEAQSIMEDLAKIKQRKATEMNEGADYEEVEAQLKHALTKTTASIQSLSKSVTAKGQYLDKLRQSLAAARQVFASMQEKLYQGNEHIAKLTSRKEMLEEMKENMQGYFFGVKEVLRASKKENWQDMIGVVIDLLDVPTAYMTAIDTILGAQAQHIVVQNDRAARKAIQWLKRENKGRATFLPVDSITERTIPANVEASLRKEAGYIGLASQLVSIDPAYERVTSHLLGNIIVVDQLDTATKIAGLTNRRYRIVTLDGDVVSPGGAISGGAKKQTNQSLFTREKEIMTLTEKLSHLLTRRDTFLADIEKKSQEIVSHEEAIDAEEAERMAEKTRLEQLQAKEHGLKIKLHQASDQLTIYDVMLRQMDEERAEKEQSLATRQERLQNVQESIQSIEQTIEQLTKEAATLADTREDIEKQLQAAQIKKAEQTERKRHIELALQAVQEQWQALAAEADSIDQELQEIARQEESFTSVDELAAEIRAVKANRKQVEDTLAEKAMLRKEKQQYIADEEQEVKGLQQVHAKFIEVIQEKEVKVNRLDVSLENRLQALQSEYTTTYEKAASIYEEVPDVAQAKQEVSQLKGAMEQLGLVNLGAIDEYDRLSERYAFLQAQQADLLEAKATLYSVIEEMDQEMTTKFKAMFEQIQVAFTAVFKKLFGGGDASLSLTDPEDLLETGIEIFARPPGKKLKNLSLLSGGERALTAIALLFAILQVRPVPFCILDEVDAALDEANVTRFGQYLQAYREETQFIVITHRKGTMEEADALYGVTMQESGVSRLVSVRLEDTSDLVEA